MDETNRLVTNRTNPSTVPSTRPPLVLGVDAGGTKTHFALLDAAGRLVDHQTAGPGNHEAMPNGFADLQLFLEKELRSFLARSGATPAAIARAVFGMAGVDTRRQHEIISEILRDLGLSSFILCNDAFLGIKSGCPSGFGVCAVNGTGFSVGGIDRHGRMLQIGGMGDYTGDEGGGGMLRAHVIRSVYEQLYKDAPETGLQKRLFNLIGITDPDDFPEILFREMAEGRCITKDIVQLAFDAANEGDAVAIGLLDKSGMEYARSIQSAVKRLDFGPETTPLEIALAGSLFTKALCPRTRDTMLRKLQEWNPRREIRVTLLTAPPVAGAALWALEPFLPEDATSRLDIRRRVIEQMRVIA